MSRSTGLAALMLATVFSAACATPLAGRSAASSSSAEIRDQLFKLQKDSARMISQLDRLEQEAGDSGAQAVCAEAASRLDELQRRLAALEEQTLATQSRIDQTLAELRAMRRGGFGGSYAGTGNAGTQSGVWESPPPADDPAAQPSAPTAATLGGMPPEDLFNAAYADYSRGKYELALAGFEAARNADPAGKLAAESQYWLGETYYAMGRHLEAARAFERVVTDYPASERTTGARLKKGLALFEARRTTEGVAELQFVIENWPDSDEARIAREYFRRKGIVEN